jgi:hypothetical protein
MKRYKLFDDDNFNMCGCQDPSFDGIQYSMLLCAHHSEITNQRHFNVHKGLFQFQESWKKDGGYPFHDDDCSGSS